MININVFWWETKYTYIYQQNFFPWFDFGVCYTFRRMLKERSGSSRERPTNLLEMYVCVTIVVKYVLCVLMATG